jgi:hypothetical protein
MTLINLTDQDDVMVFDTFREARDVAAANIKGHPAWYVLTLPNMSGFVVKYRPGGPYYPCLDEHPDLWTVKPLTMPLVQGGKGQ